MQGRIACTKYDLFSFGPYPPSKVVFRYHPDNRISLDAGEISEKNKIIETLANSGKKVEINPLYRFLSVVEDDHSIIFDLGDTDFGEYLLTDISHPEWNQNDKRSKMSHPVSISAITISSDHRLIIGHRSTKVVSYSGKIQTIPGGYIHPPDSIQITAEKELDEELGVKPHEISEMELTGVAEIYPSGKPEILIVLRLNIPAAEVLSRKGIDRWEIDRFETIAESKDSIVDYLRDNNEVLTPASHASLMVFAIQNFGIESLAGILPPDYPGG